MRKLRRRYILFVLFAITLFVYGYWQNTDLMVSQYTVGSPKIPVAFDGFTIVHISDLHNTNFGENNERLLQRCREQQPDIIVITGDLIDRRRKGDEAALAFLRGALNIAPVYYVSGNHEQWADDGIYEELCQKLDDMGVHRMDGVDDVIERDGQRIAICGVADPAEAFGSRADREQVLAHMQAKLYELPHDKEIFTLLLSHRPELFEAYATQGFDLIFSGHAHGGQVRLPWAWYAPDQGFFPAYTAGAYTQDGSTMIVSRGLGNSVVPVRIANRPDVVTVTLQAQ